jgi:hypothetical protein
VAAVITVRWGAMPEVEADQLKEAVERMHGGTATLAQSVPVRETFQGQVVWEGVVHVFDLTGHPTATRAYGWSSPRSPTGRIFSRPGWGNPMSPCCCSTGSPGVTERR